MLGEAHISTAGAADVDQVNNIAREMVRTPPPHQPQRVCWLS